MDASIRRWQTLAFDKFQQQPAAPRGNPPIVESLPKPGPGTWHKVPIGNGVSSNPLVTVRIVGQPVCTVSTPFSCRRQGA